MTTQVNNQLTECNRCKDNGYPNQMIGFVKTDRKKPDGKIFWDLVNADMSAHIHKTTVVLPDIEEQGSLPETDQKVNPGNVIDHTNEEVMLRMCLALEDIAKTLKNSGDGN